MAPIWRGLFKSGELDRIYLNFSDPWPKSRHAKRRLTHESFLARYETVLKKRGEIHFKTDNRKLFEYSLRFHVGLRDDSSGCVAGFACGNA